MGKLDRDVLCRLVLNSFDFTDAHCLCFSLSSQYCTFVTGSIVREASRCHFWENIQSLLVDSFKIYLEDAMTPLHLNILLSGTLEWHAYC